MVTTRNLELPYIAASQALKHITHNEALQALDTLIHLCVKAELPSPPAIAEDGDRYIVATNAQGDWAGHAGAVAVKLDGIWRFHAPRAGWVAWADDSRQLRVWNGTAWVAPEVAVASVAMLGINATASLGNRLAVASDATLLTHAGTGHQLKVNKATAGNSASLLFQTGYEGQAEIGTTGDDGLHLRTRSNAQGWRDRVYIDRETGAVGVGTTAPAVGDGTGVAVHIHAGNSTAEWSVSRYTVGAEAGPGDGFIVGNLGGTAYLWNYETSPILFGTNSMTRMTVSAGGDVGIGVANPTCRLHVSGPIRAAAYTISALPSAGAVGAGGIVMVTDGAVGPVLAYSDGTIWRRATDGAPVA